MASKNRLLGSGVEHPEYTDQVISTKEESKIDVSGHGWQRQCKICGLVFGSMDDLNRHGVKDHGGSGDIW